MKKLVLLMLFACIFYSVKAEDKPKPVKSKIKAVTVFLSGAQVTSAAETSIPAGASTIVFTDLTSNINPQSIQVKGEGNFSILSVSHQLNYLRSQELTKEIQQLQDSIFLLQKEIEFQNAMLSVYNDEESLVLANKSLSGDNVGVKATDIKDAADFYRSRLTDIRTTKLTIAAKIKKLNDRMAILSNQFNTLNASQNDPSSEIVVILSADAATTGKFTIQYLVYNAGWVAGYDMRAIDVNNPIELVYKANVWQTTGMDWDNVKLTLCTGNPTQSGVRPTLSAWYLSFLSDYGYFSSDRDGAAALGSSTPVTVNEVTLKTKDEEQAKTGSYYTTVNENQTNVQFDITIPYSIPSDGKYKIVEIQQNTLPAQYEYYSAPKLDGDAFLMARVSGWEQYNLLPGEMNLFFEGTYLGKSYIDPRYTKDTLDISLGRDDNISITREKLKDFSSTKLIGTNTKETYTYEITVRNKKKGAVSLVIEDQLPISSDKDIVVEQLEISGGLLDETSGKITWKFELKPSETKKFRLSYSVKYPKDKQINL
jgi:uncharacterized protein (TIGR02231 family)